MLLAKAAAPAGLSTGAPACQGQHFWKVEPGEKAELASEGSHPAEEALGVKAEPAWAGWRHAVGVPDAKAVPASVGCCPAREELGAKVALASADLHPVAEGLDAKAVPAEKAEALALGPEADSSPGAACLRFFAEEQSRRPKRPQRQ